MPQRKLVVIGNGMAGAWALAAHRVVVLRGRALWWFVALVQLSIVAQVTVGVGLVAGQGIDPPQFHLFYGFVAFITVGIVYSYRQSMRAHRYLLYGFASLFLMGLGNQGHARRGRLSAPQVESRLRSSANWFCNSPGSLSPTRV